MTRKEILIGIALFVVGAFVVIAGAKFAASTNKQSAVMEAAAAAPAATASAADMAALAPAAGKAAAPAAAQAKQDPPRDFDDWRVACVTPPAKAKKQCTMFQRVAVKSDNKQELALAATVETGQMKDKDTVKDVTLIRIITPLGTILTPGMAIKIDNDKEIKVPYSQCLSGGCRADLIFDQPTIDKLRKGTKMFVAYRLPNGKDMTFPISLKGFAPALDALAQASSKG